MKRSGGQRGGGRGQGDDDDDGDDSDFGDSWLRRLLGTLPFVLPARGMTLGGRFEVLNRLGSGAMGVVFSALDAKLQRKVALKFLVAREGLDEERRLFLLRQEAQAIAQLAHENIVRIFDVTEWADGTPYEGCEAPPEPVPFLVMEYLEGEPLGALLRRERLGWRRVLALLSDIAEGLAHAHEQHVIHRDLKPGNVFITREGTAKLLDFGLAHLMDAGAELDPSLSTAGTPSYKAPEQWRGEPQDERADIWAVGILLYEMLAGRHPYRGAMLRDALRARVLSDEPVPSVRECCSDVPVELEALLSSMLEKSPERRLPSAVELRQHLRELGARLGSWREPSRGAVSQRRQVTLVSCVLAGEVERLDAQDLDELEAAFHQVCGELFQKHGGFVLPAEGKGVLACFGYPAASEHVSECAVRAGHELTRTLRDALGRKGPLVARVRLAAQVGIHTDTVMLDERASPSWGTAPSLHGEAPRVATWLARQAEPDSVLLSATTRALVKRAFEVEPLGARDFEGRSGPRSLEVYRLERACPSVSRFVSALTPMVGRERELRELLGAWDEVRRGRGAFVLVRGEAGIGKSRLLQELHRQVPAGTFLHLRCQCWAQFRHSAYQPIIEMLQHLLHLSPQRPPEQNMARLKEELSRFGLSPEQVLLVASFLALPVADASWGLQLSPERRKEKTFEALTSLLLRLAEERPVLAIFEDLHWADPSTLQLLGHLLEHTRTARLGVFLSVRADFLPSWAKRDTLRVLPLDRLSAEESATLVRELAGAEALSEEAVAQLVARTDGIPLFAEEMTRTVVEQAQGPGAVGTHPTSIPVTLNELLLARLDQLPTWQKELAWLCAVVGRSFTQALLAPLTERDDAALGRDLRALIGVGLVRPLEGTTGPAYQFRHALIQEAAYQSLPRGTQRRHHARIARVLAEHFPQVAETQPEVLAHHYTEAGDAEVAIRHWRRAGALACRRSASVEAVSHYERALSLLRGLPDASERTGEELQLLMALGLPLLQVEGCSERLGQTYARARVLLIALGDEVAKLDLSYWGIYSYYFVLARFTEAHEVATHLERLGERLGNPELLALGLRMKATDFFTFGNLPAALEHTERALGCSDFSLEVHRSLALKHWLDPRAAALAYASMVHSVAARKEAARDCAREAVQLANRIGHPHTRAVVLTYVALGCQLLEDVESAARWAEAGQALSREHQFRIWLGWSRLIQSWVWARRGAPSKALALLDETLAHWEKFGLRAGMPLYLGMRADMLLALGRPSEALKEVAQALQLARATGERSYVAELHRFEGLSYRALGKEDLARHCLLQALTVARQQGAITFLQRAEACLYPLHSPQPPAPAS